MLRRLDHGLAEAILDRAAGILALELQEQAAGTGIQAAYLDHRRVADAVQNIVKDGAGRSHSEPPRYSAAISGISRKGCGRPAQYLDTFFYARRSAERRVGKKCVSQVKYR